MWHQILTWLFLMISGIIAKLYSLLYLKVDIKGRENITLDTHGVLFSANHQTLADSWFIMAHMRSMLHMMLKPAFLPWNIPEGNNYFATPIMQFIFSHLRCLPVQRKSMDVKAKQNFFARISIILKTGNILIFFEETRTRNGEIGKAKLGAGTIAYKNGCKIIPIRINGFSEVMPVGSKWYYFLVPFKHRKKVSIVYGPPVQYDDLLVEPEKKRHFP